MKTTLHPSLQVLVLPELLTIQNQKMFLDDDWALIRRWDDLVLRKGYLTHPSVDNGALGILEEELDDGDFVDLNLKRPRALASISDYQQCLEIVSASYAQGLRACLRERTVRLSVDGTLWGSASSKKGLQVLFGEYLSRVNPPTSLAATTGVFLSASLRRDSPNTMQQRLEERRSLVALIAIIFLVALAAFGVAPELALSASVAIASLVYAINKYRDVASPVGRNTSKAIASAAIGVMWLVLNSDDRVLSYPLLIPLFFLTFSACLWRFEDFRCRWRGVYLVFFFATNALMTLEDIVFDFHSVPVVISMLSAILSILAATCFLRFRDIHMKQVTQVRAPRIARVDVVVLGGVFVTSWILAVALFLFGPHFLRRPFDFLELIPLFLGWF